MSELILVRHGQASFFSDDYDRLSATGELQSQRLAEYWLARGVSFDEIYSGPLKRQIRTGEVVADTYRRAARPLPELKLIDELAEYDGDGIVRSLLPRLAESDPRIQGLADEYKLAEGEREKYKTFHRMLAATAEAWLRGEVAAPDVESWRDFHHRVRRALEKITSGKTGGRRIAVFTSGGPISIAAQMAMQAPEPLALELNWRIRNCAVTGIVFSQGKFTLDHFNSLAHLDDPQLWTYR
jgi:broad specificity phosphatase PhoE